MPDCGANCNISRVRLCHKRCVSRWAHRCSTYGHFTPFICVLRRNQLLVNLRKDTRDWRYGRDPVRDRHYAAWSSFAHLLGTRAWGMSDCQSILTEPLRPLYLHFLLYRLSLFHLFEIWLLLLITIPRITVVYGFVANLLSSTLTPPSPCVHTRNKKMECPVFIAA